MIRIAICDDETAQIALFHTAAAQWFVAHPAWDVEILTFTSPLLFLESLYKNGGFDIVLLDICMPDLLGTDVAQEIRRRKDRTEIIFLTNSSEYAVDAFALRAAHYLIKPITKARFDEAMTRVMAQFDANVPRILSVKGENGEYRCVDIDEIQYMESRGHAIQFHLNTETCTEARRSLARLWEDLEKLSPGEFIVPYKGFLVNQRAIVTIDSRCIRLSCGAEIPIRRGDFRDIQAKYVSYRFRKKNTVNEVRYE